MNAGILVLLTSMTAAMSITVLVVVTMLVPPLPLILGRYRGNIKTRRCGSEYCGGGRIE